MRWLRQLSSNLIHNKLSCAELPLKMHGASQLIIIYCRTRKQEVMTLFWYFLFHFATKVQSTNNLYRIRNVAHISSLLVTCKQHSCMTPFVSWKRTTFSPPSPVSLALTLCSLLIDTHLAASSVVRLIVTRGLATVLSCVDDFHRRP